MNQSSSRRQTLFRCVGAISVLKTQPCFPYSHSIFTMKLLKIDGSTVERISEYVSLRRREYLNNAYVVLFCVAAFVKVAVRK